MRIDAIAPAGVGHRRLALSFYHANYPEGVRDKRYALDVLVRGEHYLLARSAEHDPVRLMLIYEVSWHWMQAHFGVEQPTEADDIQRWLTKSP
jgi:hypothetical protein